MTCRVTYAYATTCGRYIARTGTEQLCKRYFQDRVSLVVPPQYAVVRAGLSPSPGPFVWLGVISRAAEGLRRAQRSYIGPTGLRDGYR